MIRQALAGKRIAVTGVDRLPRHRPGRAAAALRCPTASSSCSSARAGARSAAQRVQREIFAQRRLRPPPRRAGQDGFDEEMAAAGHRHRRRRRHRRPRPRRRRAAPRSASCDIVIHSAATVSFDSPLDGAVEVNLLGPSASPQTLHEPRRHAAPRRRVDLLRRRQPARRRARGAGAATARSTSASTGAARSPPPAGPRADAEAASRDPEQLAAFRTEARHELGAAGTPAAGGEDRAAPRALGDRPAGRGRPGPRASARLARRLRLHQGPRRAGADRDRRATCRSRSCARRSSSRRWPSRARAGSAASAWPSR